MIFPDSELSLESAVALTDAGIAYRTADNKRISLGWPGAVRDVVRAGNVAPGISNATFVALGPPRLNQAGQIAFAASVTPGSTLADGVWVWTNGVLRLAYRYGARPPELAVGLNIATDSRAYCNVAAPDQPAVRINGAGKARMATCPARASTGSLTQTVKLARAWP